MSRRIVLPLAALLLTPACKQQQIATATPIDELPPLIIPAELRVDAGSMGSGGSETRIADNDVRDDRAPANSDWRAAADEPGPRNSGGGGGKASAGGLVSASPQPTAYALIVGIEKYRDVTPAGGARSDAEKFAELARVTLGVPEDNIKLLLDDRASRTDIAKQLRWLQANVPSGGRVYFYFSGHGAPEPTSGVSYIVPFDGDPQYLKETAIPMTEVLGDLEKTKAKDVLAMADSCFSGAGGRSVLAPGTRPLVRVEEVKPQTRVAMLSASSGAEISGPAADGSGGLFSKYLIEALGSGQGDINGDGQISLKELAEWVGPRVKREAKKANREQTPHLSLGKKLSTADEFIVSWGYSR
ncbi:Caspase domain-containing protein [Nannocystis exedens]|uniref:Caspase domain-containing protein n=1 Tax=Nannocystis exedens TaxID=54 RepID=A0A1I2IBQ3_9BACT|nr:caspase family protein [Nannocystis exedens]PCC73164.1 Caspase domain protein [Nannocystis exedens]SFF39078.1 Caspase domain-containing protein [Nannocystis exedens]